MKGKGKRISLDEKTKAGTKLHNIYATIPISSYWNDELAYAGRIYSRLPVENVLIEVMEGGFIFLGVCL